MAFSPVTTLRNQGVTITRGQSFDSGTLTVTDSGGVTPVDISSVIDIVVTIKRADNSIIVLQKLLTGGGVVFITDGTNGQLKWTLDALDTDCFNAQLFHYDIVLRGLTTATSVHYFTSRSELQVDSSEYCAADNLFSNRTISDLPTALVLAGTMELDGDRVDIDFTPAFYTPAIAPEALDVDDLSSHLLGIDTLIGINPLITTIVDPNADFVSFYDGSSGTVRKVKIGDLPTGEPRDKPTSIEIENPTASEDVTWFKTYKEHTVNSISAVLRGSAGQSVTFSVLWNANRSLAGNVVIASAVVTSLSGATFVPTGTAIPSDVWVWVETSAQLGTVLEFTVSLDLTP